MPPTTFDKFDVYFDLSSLMPCVLSASKFFESRLWTRMMELGTARQSNWISLISERAF